MTPDSAIVGVYLTGTSVAQWTTQILAALHFVLLSDKTYIDPVEPGR